MCIEPVKVRRLQKALISGCLAAALASCGRAAADNPEKITVAGAECVARVTGDPLQGEPWASPNDTARDFDVAGTDLGIVWEMGGACYGIFFGDTYGKGFVAGRDDPGASGGNWRCNVLGFSTDCDLSDGLTISSMAAGADGTAVELIPGGRDKSGRGDWTSIPTAAVHAAGKDYVHYFNIKTWTGWITNHSGLYRSEDGGRSWTKCETAVWGSDSNFGQAGYFKKDGWVYMAGTETGRHSRVRLARFREGDIEDLSRYEYWDGGSGSWSAGDPARAANLFEDAVGELSIAYNTGFGCWIMAYYSVVRNEISLRYASEITGPWSDPLTLVSGADYPGLYGSYIHPASLDGEDLYFLMSMWAPYNVFLMKAKLSNST